MALAYVRNVRSVGRDMRLFLGAAAIYGLGASGIAGVLINLYLLRLDLSLESIGLVTSISGLGYALFSFPAGALGARFGLRRCMVAGMALNALGLAAIPMAELVPAAWQVAWLVGTRLPASLGTALYSVNASPFAMAATSAKERNHAFSLWVGLLPLAGFVGSLLGGFLPGLFAGGNDQLLALPGPYRYGILASALLVVPAIPILQATRVTGRPSPRRRGTPRDTTPLVLIGLVILVGVLRLSGEAGIRTFFNVYLDTEIGISPAEIGAVLAIAQLASGFASLAMPIIAGRRGAHATVVIGALGASLSILPLALIPSLAFAASGFVAMSVMAAIARAAYTVFCQSIVAPGVRPIMSSATNMAAGLGSGAVALAGGYLVSTLGFRGFFLIPAALIASGALVFWARLGVPCDESSQATAEVEQERDDPSQHQRLAR